MVERVINGGFETGDVTGWTGVNAGVNSAYAHSGTYSGYMYDPSAAGGTLIQTIDLTNVNTLSFYGQNTNGTNTVVYIYFDGILGYTENVNISSWAYIELDVSTYSGNVVVKFESYLDADIWLDDVSAIPVIVPPVADCNGPYECIVDETISFDGSGSSDPDGTIVLYEWDFGDGHTDTGMIVTHSYDTEDIYTVTLTVTDNDGATDVATCQCVVTIHIESINPVSGYNHVDTNITIYGSGFIDGATITIATIPLTNVVFINTFEITATVPSGISKGDKDVKLTNPDTSNITLTNGFLVKIRIITTAPTNKGSRLRSRTIYNIVN